MMITKEAPTTPQFRLLSKKDVALILGYTTRTVDRLVTARRIPFISLPTADGKGRKTKFVDTEIQAWIRDNAVGDACRGRTGMEAAQ